MKSIFSGMLRVARGTALTLGTAVMLAVILGLATAALAANGDPWLLGRGNVATAITRLAGAAGVDGPMLRINNNNAGTNATALDLKVEPGKPPMTVDSDAKVNNLNADQLDGQDSAAFLGIGAKATDSDRLDGLDSIAFGRPITFGTKSAAGIIGSAAENYRLTSAFTPPVSGKCLVTVSTQTQNAPGDANSTLGPLYRVAIKRGSNPPANEGLSGHYFTPYSGSSTLAA